MQTTNVFLVTTLLCLMSLATFSNGQCSGIYEQCGGIGFEGPTCCAQPTPLPPYVNFIPPGSIVCVETNEHYSQCQHRCTEDEPCVVFSTGECSASVLGDTDGRGRQYCGFGTGCTNPDWCFSDPISCVCGGDVPCALTSRPGGCREPAFDPDAPELGTCGPGLRRCPGHEGEQCGGIGHEEPTTCQPGLECVMQNEYYSGCFPPAPDPTAEPM